jgi:hypothetical protein
LLMMTTMTLPSMMISCTSTCERTNGSSDIQRSNRISLSIRCISTWMSEHRWDCHNYCQHNSWLLVCLDDACLQVINRTKKDVSVSFHASDNTQTIQRTPQLDSNHSLLLVTAVMFGWFQTTYYVQYINVRFVLCTMENSMYPGNSIRYQIFVGVGMGQFLSEGEGREGKTSQCLMFI